MSTVVYPPKLLAEEITARIDFKSRLNVGETLSLATVSSYVFYGDDLSSALVLGEPVTGIDYVEFTVTGGAGGVIYKIDVAGRTTDSNVYVQEVKLAVLTSSAIL